MALAASPQMLIRIAANLGELKKNLAEGKNQIEATTAGMQKLSTSLQGDRLIQQAHNITAAVNNIGGATKLTDAEKKRLNGTLEAAIQKYAALGKEAPQALQQLAQQTRRVSDEGVGWSAKLNTVVGGAIAGVTAAVTNFGLQMVTSAVTGFGEFIRRGGEVAAMRASFSALAGGVDQATARIDAIRNTTKGLVADQDIMAASNKSLLLGLGLNSSQMGELAKTATILGRAMGQDATKSLDDLITALGRSSPMILDNLGLSVKVGEANEAYARALGKTVEELTDAEKKQAFMNAAMDAAAEKVNQIGGLHLTAADRIGQLKTSLVNVADAAANWVVNLGFVNGALDRVQTSMSTWEALLRGGPKAALENYKRVTGEIPPEVVKLGKSWLEAAPPAQALSMSMDEMDNISKKLTESVKEKAKATEKANAEAKKFTDSIKNWHLRLVELRPALRDVGDELQNIARGLEGNGTLLTRTLQETAANQKATEDWANSMGAVFAPSIKSAMGSADADTKGFWNTLKGAITGKDGMVNGLTLLQGAASKMSGGWGTAMQIGSAAARAFAGDWSGVVQLAGQYMDKLVGWVADGVKKIAGWFRSVFGGPSAEELAGREVVAAFEANLDKMLTDAQRIEAGNDAWKKTVIAIRDAYIAAGLTEEQALKDAERLWASSRQGAEASRRVIAEIEANMRGAGQAAVSAVEGIHRAIDGLPSEINIPINFEGGEGPGLPGYANGSGGIRDFGAGTLVMLHGRERVQTESQMRAEQQGQGGGGGADLAAMIDRLESVLPMAVRDGLLMAGAR